MPKQCCKTSVGVLILDEDRTEMLMIERGTAPAGIAPVAGHALDEHDSYEAAAREEVSEEVGLLADDQAMKAIRDAKKNREMVILRRSENGTEVEEAEALIETISYEWPDNDNSTVSVDFQLNEAWQEVSS